MKNEKSISHLRIAKGQIDATITMISEGRYCLDINNQIMATIALLKKAQKEILSAHMHSCFLEAACACDTEAKVSEIEALINRLL
ncbi:MAG: metal-sensing transcriptional repressor [Erysipelotrichaceae bacterium]|jgi:DNA-binding FrmR family transcriptional regulator|nr:metal-sensing transcriptional repressor [Erysipelotrichaceae bacterium]